MIIFVHVPDFYAAVEQADDTAVPGRPVIVGGDPRKGGTVTSASPEARAAGVVVGMEVVAAQRLCPEAELRSTRLPRYREVASELRAILRRVSERVEPQGLDSAYLEAPPPADPVPVAAELLVRLRADLGLSAVAGIGPVRFVAQLAGRHAGPEAIRRIPPDRARDFLGGFPVTEIWGLGPATARKLAESGIETIADLQRTPLEVLEPLVGRSAPAFRALALGEDRNPLRPSPPLKSLSREATLPSPTLDLRSLGEEVSRLAGRLEEMLSREHRAARTVVLGVRYPDGERASRMLTLREPVAKQSEIAEVALELLRRTQAGVRPVRRLRLRVTKLCRPEAEVRPRQLRLF